MKWPKAISLLLLTVFLLGNQNLFHFHSTTQGHAHEHAIDHHCEDFPENHQHLEENCSICDYSLSQGMDLNQPEQFEFEVYGVSFSAVKQHSYSFDFYSITKNKSPPFLSELPFS